jgi:Nucleotidyltransferase domain
MPLRNLALSTPEIGHSDIAAFASETVNLKREDVADYREQVRRLREKLDKYASDHPDYGLIKTLLSGSLAKGTALKTLNDIDLAFYVDAAKAPKGEPDLLEWLAARIREAYPQMKSGQIPDQGQPSLRLHHVCGQRAERRRRPGAVQGGPRRSRLISSRSTAATPS